MSAQVVVDRLDGVRRTGNGRWLARCCAHEDRAPSLSIRELADGRVLLHCFAGCSVGDVLARIELEISDLFPDDPQRDRTGRAADWQLATRRDGQQRRAAVHPGDLLACAAA